jgi:hypothetical protein
MADPPGSPAAGEDTGVGPDRGPATGTPRWVKVSAIIAAVVVLLFVILLLTGGVGGHSPRRHTSVGGLGGQAVSASVMQAHAPPQGGRA